MWSRFWEHGSTRNDTESAFLDGNITRIRKMIAGSARHVFRVIPCASVFQQKRYFPENPFRMEVSVFTSDSSGTNSTNPLIAHANPAGMPRLRLIDSHSRKTPSGVS